VFYARPVLPASQGAKVNGEQEQGEPRELPKCPICGGTGWHTDPQTNPTSIALADGTRIEAQVLICHNCRFVRFHAHGL
jgi:hypothetical protein